MSVFKNLEPELIWHYFNDILQIPRPSRKEDAMVAYLKTFAAQHGLEVKTDTVNNVLIKKPATKGMEKRKTVVLQSHLDMVCEKHSHVNHDFEKDAIKAFISDDWVKADGTTLGADDGIGIAAQLAVLASDTLNHGPLECLFTIDEETGMTGAFALEPGFFEASIVLNLDSEDEGELFIGCAGGIDTVGEIPFKPEAVKPGREAWNMRVLGLSGGHSGDEIHKGLGNSNKILNRILYTLQKTVKYRLATFNGGNLRNAIPREAEAVLVLKPKYAQKLQQVFNTLKSDILTEYKIQEPALQIQLEPTKLPLKVLDKQTQANLLAALYAMPHGVEAWSQSMPGLVETSTNLASVKFSDNNSIRIITSQRSSVNSAKTDIANKVASVLQLAGANITHSEGYPGWAPDTQSEILDIGVAAYKQLFGNKPVVRAIHAGLECGLFLDKYPHLDMISFGPTIKGAHSPDERLHIPTVKKFWDYLLLVLERIPE